MAHLVVYDWNCTLLDDFNAHLNGINACLNFMGYPSISAEEKREKFILPHYNLYPALGTSRFDFFRHRKTLRQVFADAYHALKDSIRLNDNAVETLAWSKECSVSSAVLSNYLKSGLDQSIADMGIPQYFSMVSGNKNGFQQTFWGTKYKRLQSMVKSMGVDPVQTCVVGDYSEDIEIGKKIGAISVAKTGGVMSLERLQACKPDYIIDDLGELPQILRQEWGLGA